MKYDSQRLFEENKSKSPLNDLSFLWTKLEKLQAQYGKKKKSIFFVKINFLRNLSIKYIFMIRSSDF